MKLQISIVPARGIGREAQGPTSAFTMIEIAICLAIVGFALVAIIGVLPIGMNTQRDNREETIINQDAIMLINAIRTGARGMDDLTNYVSGVAAYSATNNYLTNITSGAQIVGLLSTPGATNYAKVHSISGLATEKFSGSLISFDYLLVCENVPVPIFYPATGFGHQLTNCQSELRLRFFWPLQPNGQTGSGRQTFRATIAGRMMSTNTGAMTLYFYQPQMFTNAP